MSRGSGALTNSCQKRARRTCLCKPRLTFYFIYLFHKNNKLKSSSDKSSSSVFCSVFIRKSFVLSLSLVERNCYLFFVKSLENLRYVPPLEKFVHHLYGLKIEQPNIFHQVITVINSKLANFYVSYRVDFRRQINNSSSRHNTIGFLKVQILVYFANERLTCDYQARVPARQYGFILSGGQVTFKECGR